MARRDLSELLAFNETGTSNQDVDLSFLLCDLGVNSIEIIEALHVALDSGDLAPDQLDRLVELALPSADDVDIAALLDKAPRRCQSDTAAAACDDGDLALQSGHCLLSFPQSDPGMGHGD
jgi:hypothetical protein